MPSSARHRGGRAPGSQCQALQAGVQRVRRLGLPRIARGPPSRDPPPGVAAAGRYLPCAVPHRAVSASRSIRSRPRQYSAPTCAQAQRGARRGLAGSAFLGRQRVDLGQQGHHRQASRELADGYRERGGMAGAGEWAVIGCTGLSGIGSTARRPQSPCSKRTRSCIILWRASASARPTRPAPMCSGCALGRRLRARVPACAVPALQAAAAAAAGASLPRAAYPEHAPP